ncbi:MAG: hypothetical protein MRY81_10105 [Donghicola eburneus]|nr:hypothetical protein [Donghicola eburneus]MCI5040025.1 hypothetical protein [Donghicola eburneus]
MAIGTTAALVAGSIGSAAIGAASSSKAAKAQANAANSANETQRYIFDEQTEMTAPWRQAGQNALAALAYETGTGERPVARNLKVEERTTAAQPAVMGPTPTVDGRLWYDQRLGTWREGGDPQASVAQPATAAKTEYFVGDQRFEDRAAAEEYRDKNTGFDYGGFKASPGYDFRRDEGMDAISKMMAARGLRTSGAAAKEAGRFADGLASAEYGSHMNRLFSLAGLGQTGNAQQMSAGQNYANAVGANTMAAGRARASGYAGMNDAFQGGMNNLFTIYGMQNAGVF